MGKNKITGIPHLLGSWHSLKKTNMKKYRLSDIALGDEVYFKRTGIENYDLYWQVVVFQDNMIEIKIDDMGRKEQIFIDLQDIQILTKK